MLLAAVARGPNVSNRQRDRAIGPGISNRDPACPVDIQHRVEVSSC